MGGEWSADFSEVWLDVVAFFLREESSHTVDVGLGDSLLRNPAIAASTATKHVMFL